MVAHLEPEGRAATVASAYSGVAIRVQVRRYLGGSLSLIVALSESWPGSQFGLRNHVPASASAGGLTSVGPGPLLWAESSLPVAGPDSEIPDARVLSARILPIPAKSGNQGTLDFTIPAESPGIQVPESRFFIC